MDREEKLQCATQCLRNAEDILSKAVGTYPALDRPRRAFMRMAKAAERPVRIGILGEANSGKSSLANLLAGVPVLPSSPMANARFPVRLTYAPEPFAAAIYESGERVTFPLLNSVAQTLAFMQASAGKGILPAGKYVCGDSLKLLETGLPSDILRSVEILYLPAGLPAGSGYGIDVAIWTTVAAQPWRKSEQAQWARLPRSVRRRGLLAVTSCDLAGGKNDDLKQLQAGLETSAKAHFQGICFVADGAPDPAAAAAGNRALFAQVQYLALQFAAERVAKAMAVAHHVMAGPAAKRGHGTRPVSNGLGIHAVAKTGKDLCDGDRVTILKQPLPQSRPVRPAILRYRLGTGTAARMMARRAVQTARPPAAGERSRECRHWKMIGAAAAVACTISLAVIQLVPIGADKTPVSDPWPSVSEAGDQSPRGRTETRRNAEAEAAAVEASERRMAETEAAAAKARRLAEAEAAAVEASERRMAETEAAAAEARRLAEAEAAAEPEKRKKAEARRYRRTEPQEADWSGRALAEATLRQFNENGPTLVGR